MVLGKDNGELSHEWLEHINIASIIVDETGAIIYANKKMENFCGYALKEMESKLKWKDFVSSEDLQRVEKLLSSCSDLEEFQCEFKFVDAHKREKYVRFFLNKTANAEEYMAMLVDMTEQKQKELELRSSQQKYKERISAVEEGYYETDLKGNIVFFNESLAEMLGYDAGEMFELDYRDFYKYPEEVFKAYNEVYRTGESVKAFGWPVITKNGEEIFFEISITLVRNSYGEPTGFRGVARDITERRKAEEALQEAEARNRALLEALPDHVFLVNEEGTILDYNLSNSKLPFELEDFTFKHLRELLTPEQAENALYYIERLFESGQLQIHELESYIEGEWNIFEARLALCDEGRALAIIRDVTEYKLKEKELRESESKFKTLAESSPFAIMIFQDDYFVYVNSAGEEISGYSREELYNMHFWDIVHHDHKNIIMERGRQRQAGEYVPSPYDFKFLTKQGETRWCTLTGSTTYYNGKPAAFISIIDITPRKEMEEALRESQERYREILENMQEAYYEVDLEGNITFCNSSGLKMLGYEYDELIGMNFEKVCNNPKKVYRQFNQVFTSARPQYSLTLELIHKDGTLGYGEFSVTPIKDKEGFIVGFRGVVRDITERYRFEEQLKYLSLHDQLTDLYNRAYFENELQRLNDSREYPITIVSIDLDGLKLVNDTLGHTQGDELLVDCARVLRDSFRSSDVIARVGGDEFAVILPNTDYSTGNKIVERLYSNLEEFNKKQKVKVPLNVSIGFATAENESKILEEIFKEADDFMYREKLRKGIDARSQIIQTLIATLGEKDFISDGHVSRLEDLSIDMGRRLQLSPKQLSNIALLAQVHDIGKVGVSDDILFKKEPLDEKEWEIIRQHTEKGYRIAMASTDLSEVADLILKHHEKWDGNGYPLGLKNEEIPIECRIFAVVDAYDAMVNERPYRKAMTHEEAVAELKRCSGTQFDPKIVEVFLTVLKEDYIC